MTPLQSQLTFLTLTLALTGCGVSVNGGYSVGNGIVLFHHGFAAGESVVSGADARTFKILSTHYGKDRTHVYQAGVVIEGADPATFKPLNHLYSRDRQRGFYAGKTVSNDGLHFELIPDPEDDGQGRVAYARDSTQVYSTDRVLKGADPASFVWVPMFNGLYLTHDKVHVWEFSYETPLEGADGASFQKISTIYFRDRDAIWGASLGMDSHVRKMPQADPATFVSISEFFGKDKAHVFNTHDVVEGVDPATFQPPKGQ